MINFNKVKDAGKKWRKNVTIVKQQSSQFNELYWRRNRCPKVAFNIRRTVHHKGPTQVDLTSRYYLWPKCTLSRAHLFLVILMDKWEKSEEPAAQWILHCFSRKEKGWLLTKSMLLQWKGKWDLHGVMQSKGQMCRLYWWRFVASAALKVGQLFHHCHSLMSLPVLRRCDRLWIIQGDLRRKEVMAALKRRGYKSKGKTLLETPFIL